MKSPMKDFGYDIEDFYDIDPIFGTMADFDELMVKANTLGMFLESMLIKNYFLTIEEDSINKSQWNL